MSGRPSPFMSSTERDSAWSVPMRWERKISAWRDTGVAVPPVCSGSRRAESGATTAAASAGAAAAFNPKRRKLRLCIHPPRMHYLLRTVKRRLEHENGEAKASYSSLPQALADRDRATGYTAVVRTDG